MSMGTNATQVQSILESLFLSAIQKMTTEGKGNFISDIYVQADPETGELLIYDEEEKLVEKTIIYDWVNNTEGEDAFNRRVAGVLKPVLSSLAAQDKFEDTLFAKPLSVSLTDEDFVVIEELLFLDDDTLRLDDPLLKDLDADLDNFFAKLLSDVE